MIVYVCIWECIGSAREAVAINKPKVDPTRKRRRENESSLSILARPGDTAEGVGGPPVYQDLVEPAFLGPLSNDLLVLYF